MHELDFLELASYDTDGPGIRLLKDLDAEIEGRHVVIVEDVVDTGLSLNYLCKTLRLRSPATLAAVTLLDRPYRRLVENLPDLTRRLHRARRALRRLRLRPRGALPQPARTCTSSASAPPRPSLGGRA